MMFEKITPEEQSAISLWRNDYAFSDADSLKSYDSFASNDYLLREWEARKSEYLYKMLNSSLKISKPVSYEKSPEEIYEEIEDFRYDSNMGRAFYHNYADKITKAFPFHYWYDRVKEEDEEAFLKNSQNCENYTFLRDFLNSRNLAENNYDGPARMITFPNGKTLKFAHGCKTIRMLNKIADILNIEGFEEFRIGHSQILNQKTLKGELVLSIHPLDYFTMSDNSLDWDSCMSWRNYGCYRQGTVEMMNSPCVVVAYLTSEKPFKMGKCLWTNKKWRQLFIANPDTIVGIKSYPYYNEELSKAALNWLKELAEKNLGWNFYPTRIEMTDTSNDVIIPDDSFLEKNHCHFHFSTDYMYNDFGCCDKHLAYIRYGIRDGEFFHINYSGLSECMVCGELGISIEDEGILACQNCETFAYCEVCENTIYESEESFWVDGKLLCPECYENEVVEDSLTGEDHLRDNCISILVSVGDSLTENEIQIINDQSYYGSMSLDSENILVYPDYEYFYIFQTLDDEKSDSLERFKETFLKKDKQISVFTTTYGFTSYVVKAEDLNEEAVRDLGIDTSYLTRDYLIDHHYYRSIFGERSYF